MKRLWVIVLTVVVIVMVGLFVYVVRDQQEPVVVQPATTKVQPEPVRAEDTSLFDPTPTPAMPPDSPVTAANSAPVAPTNLDLSHPRAACVAVLRAFRARDVAAIRAATTAKDDDRLNVFCGAVPVMFAMGDLTEACAQKFADVDQSNALLRWQASAWDEALARVPQALLTVEGETATLKFADKIRMPFRMNFRKVGAAWKLDLGDIEQPARLWAAHSETLIGIIQETIADVRQGNYQTSQEALRAVDSKAEKLIDPKQTAQ